MPRIGILYTREEQGEAIVQAIRLFFAQQGIDYPVHLFQEEEQEDWERYAYLILAWEDAERAFALAERLWEAFPSLSIIYVAQSVSDIFAALKMPFFHTVRSFDMEQDLRAALRKMLYLKPPQCERIAFACGGRKLLVRRRDILYLESERHSIRLHLQRAPQGAKAVENVTETLAQCEEKLEGLGFVRIHRSFLVNMYHIGSLEKDSVLLLNGERLYISRHRIQEVRFRFENYIRHLDFM